MTGYSGGNALIERLIREYGDNDRARSRFVEAALHDPDVVTDALNYYLNSQWQYVADEMDEAAA